MLELQGFLPLGNGDEALLMASCRHAGLLLGALAVAISAAGFWKASVSEASGLGSKPQ